MKYILTKQEKAELRRKYKENVRILNQYLPEGQKIQLNMKAFNRRLDDPKEQRYYKKGLELAKRENEKNAAATRLRAKYQHLLPPGKPDPLERLCHSELAPGNSPEAEEYNDAKIKNYMLHPEAETQRRFQKLLNADFSELEKISRSPDMDNLFLDYYEKNTALVDDAFCLIGAMGHFQKEDITPEMRKFVDSIGRGYEVICTVNEKFRHLEKDYYFTLPELTEEQKETVCEAKGFFGAHEELHNLLQTANMYKVTNEASKAEFIQFFEEGRRNGVDFNEKGVLTNTVAVRQSDGKVFSLLDVTRGTYSGENAPVVTRLNAQEKAGVMKMFNKDYTKEEGYVAMDLPEQFQKPAGERARDEFITKKAMETGMPISEVDKKGMGEMAEEIKGNLKERILHTTSRQYKNFIRAMKNFEKPDRIDTYNNPRPVVNTANAYLIHKGVRTREQAMNLPQPGRDRALLCFDTMDTFQKALPANEPRLVPGTQETYLPQVQEKKDWPSAIENSNILDDDLEKEEVVEENAPVKDKEVEIENNNLIKD